MSAPGLLKMVDQVRLMMFLLKMVLVLELVGGWILVSAPVPFGSIWVLNWVGIGPGGIGDEWDQGLGLGLDNSKGLGEI